MSEDDALCERLEAIDDDAMATYPHHCLPAVTAAAARIRSLSSRIVELEAERAGIHKAIEERKGIYQAKLDQATTREHLEDDYTRADLFRHAVEAFDWLESDIQAALGRKP